MRKSAISSSLWLQFRDVTRGSTGRRFCYFSRLFRSLFAVCNCLPFHKSTDVKEARGINRVHGRSSQLKICQLLSVRRTLLNLVCNTVCGFLPKALEPTLALKLTNDFNFSVSQIGFYFFLFYAGTTLTMALMILVP